MKWKWTYLMPRNGSGVYSLPAGSTFTPNTLAQSSVVNAINNDIMTDLNTPRPIVAGGTGSSSAAAALVALGADPKVAYQTKSANYTAASSDNNSLILWTASATLSLPLAASLGSGWHMDISAFGGAVTITPTGGQTINNLASIAVPKGEGTTLICDGFNYLTESTPTSVLGTANGFLKHPTGILIQWGSITNAASDFAVTFPIAYPAGCFAVSIIPNFITPATTAYTCNTSQVTVTTFDVRCRAISGGTVSGATNLPVLWIAIGN